MLLLAGQILGEGDVSELSATRRVGGRLAAGAGYGAPLPLGLALVGDDPAPHDSTGEVDPQKFHLVFAMFVTITATGTLFTGALAWDAYKLMRAGIDIKPRKGNH